MGRDNSGGSLADALARAELLHRLGRHADARAQIGGALGGYGNEAARAAYLVGYSFVAEGRPKDAERIARERLRLDPEEWLALDLLTVSLLDRGAPRHASRAATAYRQLCPRSSRAHDLLSRAQFAEGYPRDAVMSARAGLGLDAEDLQLRTAEARGLLGMRAYSHAADRVRGLLRDSPDNPDVHLLAGQVAHAAGRARAALRHYESFLAMRPDAGVIRDAVRQLRTPWGRLRAQVGGSLRRGSVLAWAILLVVAGLILWWPFRMIVEQLLRMQGEPTLRLF